MVVADRFRVAVSYQVVSTPLSFALAILGGGGGQGGGGPVDQVAQMAAMVAVADRCGGGGPVRGHCF